MIRAVLDANVIVSGMVRFRTGSTAPARILRAWANDEFELLISEHIFDEVIRTLAKPYFQSHVDPLVFRETLEAIARHAVLIAPSIEVSGVATHPEDDRVLAGVASSNAEYLVTGDRQLQRLESFQKARIISPQGFLELLERESVGIDT